MAWIDTHAHLYLPQFAGDREAVLERATEAGIDKIFLPNIDLESIKDMHQLCDAHPGLCFPMMGLHPCSVKEDFGYVLEQMKPWFAQRKYWAVGETGIDLYWDKSTLEWQIQSFEIQINWAKELSLPLIIHARESFNEIFEVLDRMNDVRLRGVFHCFTGSVAEAQHIMSYGGFMMGIGGVLTYEKSGLSQVVPHIPHEYLLLETDAPYLAPRPHRGKRNESAYLPIVANLLAQMLDIPVDRLAEITTRNAMNMFMPSNKA